MGKESLHYVERRLLNASSLQSELRTLGIHVADVAMVDAQGCVYTHPPFVIYVISCSIYQSEGGDGIHIGVGFEVAYLNVVASSKARIVR